MKKSLLGLGLIAMLVTLALFVPRNVNSMEHKKKGRCHNGVKLCLPGPAYDAHMREHEMTTKSFDCIPLPDGACDDYQGAKGRNANGCSMIPYAD